MSDIAIKFENISKQYRLGLVGTGTISHDLNRWWHVVRGKEDPYLKVGEINNRASKATSNYVWALKDINFDVKQGEVLGIIGRNGAGKSTLLKILSRVTSPTTGSIKAKGRIASLLEVGTGFHPEMTGRENIYMNGAIMGMTKAEITRKLDEIIDFAGVEKYIDTPTKRYSSGMTVRLGFAIAAHLEPEILVVDEVLAVGDAEFQKKAIGKMQGVSQSEGRTVLFVSHNMKSVEKLCNRAILLEHGTVALDGKVLDIIAQYNTQILDSSQYNLSYNNSKVTAKPYFSSINIVNSNSEEGSILSDKEVLIKIKVENFDYQINQAITIVVRDKDGNWLLQSTDEFGDQANTSDYRECIIPPNILKGGDYFLTFAIGSRFGELYEKLEDVLCFPISDSGKLKELDLKLKGLMSPEIVKWKCL